MKPKSLWSVLALIMMTAATLAAQDQAATVAALEFQKPKNGMTKQYEEGRKQKAAWHKQQNDSQPLMVWETLTGMGTGTYIVGRFGHWGDFHKPSKTDQADLDEYQKVVAANVESLITRYYEYLPSISNLDNSAPPAKFSDIITFYVKYGKSSDFRSAIARVNDAAMKTKWPVKFGWYVIASGGDTGTWVLVLPRNSWADFGDQPNVKPFREMLKEAFGQAEADSIVDRIDNSVSSETSEIIQFRPDLSYLPAK